MHIMPIGLYLSYSTYFAYFVYETHCSVFRCLFPLLLGPASNAPGKSADSLRMSKGNNLKTSHYGAEWNDIHHLCVFSALTDD